MKYSLASVLLTFFCVWNTYSVTAQNSENNFFAGAAKSVITPPLGTSLNGHFQDRQARNVHDELHARALVLDDGSHVLGFVITDLCMVYRETLDRAKERVREFTGIPVENMMMSAVHTHSAGSACSVFQSDPDPDYLEFLEIRIADALIRAFENRTLARIGWGFGEDASQVHNRRWRLKPGKTFTNPFGGEDQVRMNPGVDNPDKLEPAGPIDPQIPVISVMAQTGEPIAILANYSLHYVGGVPNDEISADYYGMFNHRMEEMLENRDQKTPFVSIMSNGTSGDINNIDFSGKTTQAKGPYVQMKYVANRIAAEVYKVLENIEYHDHVSLSSAIEEIDVGVRLPDEEEIDRAKKIVAAAEGPEMRTSEEVYARETLLMKDYPDEVNMILQVFRIGDLGIAAIPCEVFVEIGLELKEKSAIQPMFTIELANGYYGYLPTPAHHELGGYETWRARSSFLEVNASDKISDTLLRLFENLK